MAATLRWLIALALLVAGCAAAAGEERAAAPPAGGDCPITVPNGFHPPHPYPFVPPAAHGAWHGTLGLWTMIDVDGAVWRDLPGEDGKLGQKTFWWRGGYSAAAEPQPALTVTAVDLDDPGAVVTAPHPATHAMRADTGTSMLSGLELPGPGCYRITGTYGDASLSYVVRVEA